MRILAILLLAIAAQMTAIGGVITVKPEEEPSKVLHSPDMGFVLYENYPVDQRKDGSSVMVTEPGEPFHMVHHVAVMFTWADVETAPGVYDWSKVDKAYDYWKSKGKRIQLRMSTETLLWWAQMTPPGGQGIPSWVLAKIPTDQRQDRVWAPNVTYPVVDANNKYYRQRLSSFLKEVKRHFDKQRPVTTIDLRAYGLWGEWHTGFKYTSLAKRREALKWIIDVFCRTFPDHPLLLSASHDPDTPAEYRNGPNNLYDEAFTKYYDQFLQHSCFDYALTKKGLSFRRDGCGGAVTSNERKLIDTAFTQHLRAPMFSEFVVGYGEAKAVGQHMVQWFMDDALTLHPNYISMMGFGDFCREQRPLMEYALRRMGYRFVPVQISYTNELSAGQDFTIECLWQNRGTGRALVNYELELNIYSRNGRGTKNIPLGKTGCDKWIAGREYQFKKSFRFPSLAPGSYQVGIRMVDPRTGGPIQLPMKLISQGGIIILGDLEVK